MTTVKVLNKQIFVEPFKENEIKSVTKNGFATIQQKHELTKLLVLAGNDNWTIREGDSVYVKGDTCKAPFAREIFSLNGKKGIFLPEGYILLVEAESLEAVCSPFVLTTTTTSSSK